ncbi:hypothetical protein [Halovulum sp. GXIMD14793]
MSQGDIPEDPRGLIREAYSMDGISAKDCRTVFFDWAIGAPDMADPIASIRALHNHYAPRFPDHPMTEVLQEGLVVRPARRRRRSD